MGISRLIVLGDSMLIIGAIINNSIIGGNSIFDTLYHFLSLLKGFEENSLFHIKCELNSDVDHRAQVGSWIDKI